MKLGLNNQVDARYVPLVLASDVNTQTDLYNALIDLKNNGIPNTSPTILDSSLTPRAPQTITIKGGGLDCSNRASRPDLTDQQWNYLCPLAKKKPNWLLYGAIAVLLGAMLARNKTTTRPRKP